MAVLERLTPIALGSAIGSWGVVWNKYWIVSFHEFCNHIAFYSKKYRSLWVCLYIILNVLIYFSQNRLIFQFESLLWLQMRTQTLSSILNFALSLTRNSSSTSAELPWMAPKYHLWLIKMLKFSLQCDQCEIATWAVWAWRW